MVDQHAVIRTLEQSYSAGRLSRREFVRALTAATALITFGGSTARAFVRRIDSQGVRRG